MTQINTQPAHVQAIYTTMTGIILHENGKSRPATLDEIEQDYSQAKLDAVMSAPGQWVTIAGNPNAHRVIVIERASVGNMAYIICENAGGDTFNLSDLASKFSEAPIGTTGWIMRAGSRWEFVRDRTAADDAQDAFIAECDAYEREKQARLTTRPITTTVQKLDPAAWGKTA